MTAEEFKAKCIAISELMKDMSEEEQQDLVQFLAEKISLAKGKNPYI